MLMDMSEYEETIYKTRKPKFLKDLKEARNRLDMIYEEKNKRLIDASKLPLKDSLRAIKYVASQIDGVNYDLCFAKIKLREGRCGELLDYNLAFLVDPNKKKEAIEELMNKYDEERDESHKLESPAENFIQLAYYKDTDEPKILYIDEKLKYITSIDMDSQCAVFDANHSYILDYTDAIVSERINDTSTNHTVTYDSMIWVANKFIRSYKNVDIQKLTFESNEN